MSIEEISKEEFDRFAKEHILKSFFQSKQYGSLMTHSDFSVMYIGAYEDKNMVGASLIMYKTIAPSMKYGYAPRGFLIDYYDNELLKKFTKKVKEFFFMRGFAFIKVNPEITYSILDYEERSKRVNKNVRDLIEKMKDLGYDKLKDNLYFESVLPKYTPVIRLENYQLDELDKDIIKNASYAELKGMRLIKGTKDDLETFYEFVKDKKNKTLTYYNYFYENFSEDDMVDLLLVEVNYPTYVKYLQKEYIYENERNEKINQIFVENPKDINAYEDKMESDKVVNSISSNIALVNKMMEDSHTKEIVGGAFIVKNQGRATIIITGNTNKYNEIDIKSFMFYKIIESYKKAGYKFLDLYGITADFSDNNPYKKLNDFKLQFNPTVYEYIGEFDLIINKTFHSLLWSTNKIQKEFYKPAIKKD